MKRPPDFYTRKNTQLDRQITDHGEFLFGRWVAAGMITLPKPPKPVEDEGLTLRTYGTRWKFANMQQR